LEYFKTAYNEDLTLKSNPNIKIIAWTFGLSFSDIETDVVYAGGH
jgi:hypothetical protein